MDAGADDYVAKPFKVGELLARVRALLRRVNPVPEDEVLAMDDLVVEVGSHRALLAGQDLALTPKEFDLLVLLLVRAGKVVTREEIMRGVWHTECFGATKTLDMHMSTLRRKLGDAGWRLTTVRGVGFRF